MNQSRRDNRIRAIQRLDQDHTDVCRAERRRLESILECETHEVWVGEGARSLAEWIASRYGLSVWAARRLINAAHALPSLPRIDEAFTNGELPLQKVVELCRFATPDDEAKLVNWAERVTTTTIRRRADRELRKSLQEAIDGDRSRYLSYWWLDDGSLGLEGQFPADQGAVIAKALDRLADRRPDVVEEDSVPSLSHETLEVRRADALYSMASRDIADDQSPDLATVIVHAPLAALSGHDERGCEIDNGPVIHAETARRMSCDGRTRFVLHNDLGDVVGIGRTDRNPPPWMKQQLKNRDRGCTFPGCESKRFLHAHHIQHWSRGGRTDLDNLVLVCTFHHKLVHEYGWSVELGDEPGITRWFRPGGRIYEPGRAPEEQNIHEQEVPEQRVLEKAG